MAGPSSGRARLTPVRRAQGSFRSARLDAVRFGTETETDERIEDVREDEIAFPDNLEFSFEIPQEVKNIEV